MAEAAFKQMIATFIRQTRPQTFRHGKPPRYPQRCITSTSTAKLQPAEEQDRSHWQVHPLVSDAQVSIPDSKTRLQKLRDEPEPRPFSSFLTDNYSREHNYLRISLTERCNLRCIYCMPEEGIQLSPPEHNLTTPEIIYISSLFVDQGVDKIRLTGGEPTVRKDILDLMRQIGQLRQNGLKELCLTTNGISLHRKLDSMLDSGLTGVNLSLDTLDPFQFTIMTRRNGHDAVMKSINRILEMNKLGAGIKLKINCVVMRGINDKEILPFVKLGKDKDLEVRFIEYMPFDGNKWSQKKMLGFQEMLALIRQEYPGVEKVQDHANDTSKTYKIPGFAGRIGFITSMTHNFCGTCNRLRITSDGNLKVCLFGNSEVSLRDILRESNAGRPIDAEAMEAIKQIESNRKQAAPGSTGTIGVSEREARLLDVIGMAVKRKKEKHADDCQRVHNSHTPYRIHSPLRTESPLLAVRSHTAFSKSIPLHLLSHSSQSSMFQQHRYRSTFLLKRTYITKKQLRRYIYSVPTHRHIEYNPLNRIGTRETFIEQSRNRQVVLDAAQLGCKVVRFSTKGGRAQKDESQGRPTSPLTHLTSSGEAHMVDVGRKGETHRSATAVCNLLFSKAGTYHSLMLATLKKGDALAVARIAGIQAAKKTADLIPLAHPALSITAVKVDIEPFHADYDEVGSRIYLADLEPSSHGGVQITATVNCYGKTGVEMEALTSANVAALTMFDMLKGIDKTMVITSSRVVEKTGGKSGSWKWNPQNQKVEKPSDTIPEPKPTTITSSSSPLTSTQFTPFFGSDNDLDETSAQSILESEWANLTNSFSTTTTTPRTDPSPPKTITFSSTTRPPLKWEPITRDDLSGEAYMRADADGFKKAREERYEEWLKKM